jgi:hypothetical protein
LGKAAFDYIRLDILKVLDGLKTMSHPLCSCFHNFHHQHHL